MASYWPTLGKYVEGLEKAGKLVRVTTPINKDTELHPLVRLQFRGLPESQRKAFLFENVIDSRGRKYDIPVLVGALAGSAEIYALGMGCKLEEIENVWRKALANQVPPVAVDKRRLPGGRDHRRRAQARRRRARRGCRSRSRRRASTTRPTRRPAIGSRRTPKPACTISATTAAW